MTQRDMSNSVQPTSRYDTLPTPHNLDADIARHGAPEHAASLADNGSKSRETELDTARHGAPSHGLFDEKAFVAAKENAVLTTADGNPQHAATGYVSQLEKRVEEKDDFIALLKGQLSAKDEQISELSTRYRETHTLLGAMQRMIAPLLGQADPYQNVEQRQSTRVDNSTPQGN
jgi:septal ring factor EnvC (AmiA/AmiB activator)